MDNSPSALIQALTWYSDTFLGRAPALFTVLGAVLLALAGATLGLYLRIHSAGYLTRGRALGTVSRSRVIRSEGGAPVQDAAQYLAVEYVDEHGTTRHGLLSEWEEDYARFAQDEALTLRVVANPAYDDLYIAQRRGAPKLALGFAAAGVLCLFRFWQTPLLWLGCMLLMILAGVLSFRFLSRLPAPTEVPAEKTFEAHEIQALRAREGR
jgi:hypothetical protein